MKNINLKDVEQAIISGMIKGYSENQLLQTNYNDFQSKITEYLLTVNVAQSLLKWNKHHTYNISIEYPAVDFFNNAFKLVDIKYDISSNILAHSTINQRGEHKSTTRNNNDKGNIEKIDIAILVDCPDQHIESMRSLVGIEIKAINPNKTDVIKDVTRLSEAINLQDNISENSILAGYSTFIQKLSMDKYEDMILTKQINLDLIEKFKSKWNKIINQIDHVHIIDFFIVEVVSEEDISEIYTSLDKDYHDIVSETGAVIGVLLKVSKDTLK
jgi:hypothetical protein